MSVNCQRSPAGVLLNPIAADEKVERIFPAGAELQTVQPKRLNEALRLSLPRKPRRPDLNRHPTRISGATASPGIHQQIAEPPRATSVGQS